MLKRLHSSDFFLLTCCMKSLKLSSYPANIRLGEAREGWATGCSTVATAHDLTPTTTPGDFTETGTRSLLLLGSVGSFSLQLPARTAHHKSTTQKMSMAKVHVHLQCQPKGLLAPFDSFLDHRLRRSHGLSGAEDLRGPLK